MPCLNKNKKMNHSKIKVPVTVLMVTSMIFLSARLQAQISAQQILTKMDKVVYGPKDKVADVEMTMVNLSTGKKTVKKAILMQKGADKKLFIYTWPVPDKGIGTLTSGSDIYLYIPIFKKPKKITSLSESSTFNSSDFSLSDTPNSSYSQTYNPELLSSTKDAWILKLIPKSKNSNYGYLEVTVNKIHFYPEKIGYYGRNGTKIKEAVYNYIKPGKYWAAKEVTMKDLKKRHSTRIIMSNIKFDQGLKDSLFTSDNLVKLAEEKRAEKSNK